MVLKTQVRFIGTEPESFIDPSGHAAFAVRELDTPIKGISIPMSLSPIDNYFNTEIAHEQLFFHDTMENIGHSDGHAVINESFAGKGYQWRNERTFNDDLMRISVDNTPMGEYRLFGNNCQDWADNVKSTYGNFENSYFIDRDSFGLGNSFDYGSSFKFDYGFNDNGSTSMEWSW